MLNDDLNNRFRGLQLSKYVAKFRLLERGLLDAAQGVDDLHIRVSVKRQKKKEEDEGPAANEPPQLPDETVHEFIMRVGLYVAVHLSRSPSNKRDHYKDASVFQARKDLINKFLKGTLLKQCNECSRSVF